MSGREKCRTMILIPTLYTTNFTEPLSYQGSAFLKL
ncbi:3-hydroxylacyl-ACP dehydratase, partial [Acinetobacter baumannii]